MTATATLLDASSVHQVPIAELAASPVEGSVTYRVD